MEDVYFSRYRNIKINRVLIQQYAYKLRIMHVCWTVRELFANISENAP